VVSASTAEVITGIKTIRKIQHATNVVKEITYKILATKSRIILETTEETIQNPTIDTNIMP